MKRLAAVTLLLLMLALPGAALAAPAPKTSLNEIENEVMCTVCRVPLNVAESPEADRERAFIQALVTQGRTKAEIKQALVDQYGPAVLAVPQSSGFDLAAWVVPIAVVVVAGAGLAIVVPRWRRSRAHAAAGEAGAGSGLSEEDAERLARDLARYD
jgi:cytochrome c-type biogenesis protein CcmH/NrfF